MMAERSLRTGDCRRASPRSRREQRRQDAAGRAGSDVSAEYGPVAVLDASEWALDKARVEQTLAYVGMLGGLLADLGYDVFAIRSLPGLDASPAFVGWVGGGETSSERDQLGAVDAPGVSIGPKLPARESWASIEPEGPPADIEFIRSTLQTIRRLTDQEHGLQAPASGADLSTVSSTVRHGTGVYRPGQPSYDERLNPSSRARSGAERDGLNGRSEGS